MFAVVKRKLFIHGSMAKVINQKTFKCNDFRHMQGRMPLLGGVLMEAQAFITTHIAHWFKNAKIGSALVFFLIASICEAKAFSVRIDSAAMDTTVFLNQEVIVTAARQQGSAFNRPEAISVLNRRKLSLLAPMSMPDALSSIPGVWMQKTNHGGGSPFIRGLTGYQTLLLIDGVRFNNTTFRSGPNQYLNTIDPLMTERIEIIRGQGSVQYGSDAIGGVVQMFTHSPEFTSGDTKLRGQLYSKYLSSNMEKTGRMAVGMGGRNLAFTAGFTSKNLGDIKAGGNLGTQRPTGYDEHSFDFKLRQKIKGQHLFTAAYQRHIQTDVPLYHKIVTGEYERYHFDTQQRDMAYVRWETFSKQKMWSEMRLTQSFQHSLETRSKRKTSETTTKKEEDKVSTLGTVFEVVSRPSDQWSISSGVEFYYDKVNSSGLEYTQGTSTATSYRGLYPDNSSAANFAAFSLHTLKKDRISFSFGGRYNAVWLNVADELFGTTTITPTALVGNAGIVYELNEGINLIGTVNTGFRAPNINDVSSFGIADFRYEVPNFDLKPEKSLNFEVGLKTKKDRLSSGIYLFRNQLRDLIANVATTYQGQSTMDGVQVYRRENVRSAVVQGVESELELLLSESFLAQANMTYTHGQNTSKDEPMRRIPPLYGSTGLFYHINSKVRIKGAWAFAAKQTRLSQGDIDDDRIAEGGTDAWHTADLSVHYISRHVQVQTGLKNILNQAYRVHGSGVDGIGRSLWLSLKVDI